MTGFAGPGKYDDLCTLVRKRAKAKTVLVIVFDGKKGSGFSFQGDLLALHSVPEILESVATDIREQRQAGAA